MPKRFAVMAQAPGTSIPRAPLFPRGKQSEFLLKVPYFRDSSVASLPQNDSYVDYPEDSLLTDKAVFAKTKPDTAGL